MSEKKIAITEYLAIELESERWYCKNCDHNIGDAKDNYKMVLRLD